MLGEVREQAHCFLLAHSFPMARGAGLITDTTVVYKTRFLFRFALSEFCPSLRFPTLSLKGNQGDFTVQMLMSERFQKEFQMLGVGSTSVVC